MNYYICIHIDYPDIIINVVLHERKRALLAKQEKIIYNYQMVYILEIMNTDTFRTLIEKNLTEKAIKE